MLVKLPKDESFIEKWVNIDPEQIGEVRLEESACLVNLYHRDDSLIEERVFEMSGAAKAWAEAVVKLVNEGERQPKFPQFSVTNEFVPPTPEKYMLDKVYAYDPETKETSALTPDEFDRLVRRLSAERQPKAVELPSEPTDEQITKACLAYRGDYGSADAPRRHMVRNEAADWLRAWRKALT